jgi:hypothetical protein
LLLYPYPGSGFRIRIHKVMDVDPIRVHTTAMNSLIRVNLYRYI